MVTADRREDSLWRFLAERARAASDGRLVANAGLGATMAVAALLWRGPGWTAVCGVALCFASYGLWGIVDRELRERQSRGSSGVLGTLRLMRILAATVGSLAALAVLFSGLALALGTWVS